MSGYQHKVSSMRNKTIIRAKIQGLALRIRKWANYQSGGKGQGQSGNKENEDVQENVILELLDASGRNVLCNPNEVISTDRGMGREKNPTKKSDTKAYQLPWSPCEWLTG